MAEKSFTVISLPQMVDLALNSPEVGIVNFTVLHSLLHVIVNQLDLGDCNVEFRGSDSERLQNYIETAKPGPIITLTEYTVGADGKSRKKRRGSKKTGKRSSVDEKGKKDENQKEKEIAIIKKEDDGSQDAESSGSYQTIVVVEPASREKVGEKPKFTIALTKEQLGKLQKDIKDLQKQVRELTEMPATTGLLDALRSSRESGGASSPVLDMFQILTLVKRMDAAEGAVNKLASMLEDLAVEHTNLISATSNMVSDKKPSVSYKEPSQTAGLDLVAKSQELRKSLDGTAGGATQVNELLGLVKHIEPRIKELEDTVKNLASSTASRTQSARVSSSAAPKKEPHKKPMTGKSKNVVAASAPSTDDVGELGSQRNTIEPSVENYNEIVPSAEINEADDDGTENPMAEGVDINSSALTLLPPRAAIAILQKEILNMKDSFKANDTGLEALKEVLALKDTLMSGTNQQNMPPEVKLGQLDLRINDMKEQFSTLDTVYQQHFSNVGDKMVHLDKEISALWERINLGLPAGDSSLTNTQNLQELYYRLSQLQDEMVALTETSNKIMAEREGKENTLDVMLEQIELLKTVKADKEDLEDALADKADACQINRKVSHEQFDAAYDEMTKSLEDALGKLKKQEELWIQSLNDLQKEIGNKLDKMELTPLKDFINLKLKGIQDKVKKISALKQEHEAAGTKSKLLRNVNCISCDADVIMKKTTDITLFPKPYAMPANKSPAPYLAYELDQLRKQQKLLPNSKNLHMFESALQNGKSKLSDPDHLCNRYCGGSHTVTTPQQRVMRVGHFMEQWGPEISPINEVLIKGTDGHLYKGRDDATLRALASEKAPTPRVDSPAMVITEYNLNKDIKSDSVHNTAQRESTFNTGKADSLNTAGKADGIGQREGSYVAGGSSRLEPRGSQEKRPKTSIDKQSDAPVANQGSKRGSLRSAEIK